MLNIHGNHPESYVVHKREAKTETKPPRRLFLCVHAAWAVFLLLTVKQRIWCFVFDWSLLLITERNAEIAINFIQIIWKMNRKKRQKGWWRAIHVLTKHKVVQNTVRLRILAEKSEQSSSVKAAVLKLHILWEMPFLDKSVLIYCLSDIEDHWYYYLP